MLAVLSKQSLSPSVVVPLSGGSGVDEVWGIAADSTGQLWIAGANDVTNEPKFWGVNANMTGQACGFNVNPTPSFGRAIASNGTSVFMLGTRNDQAIGYRFNTNSAQCTAQGPCPCQPDDMFEEIPFGGIHTEPRGAVFVGTTLYFTGFATDSGSNYFGYVARMDATTAQLLGFTTWNPTNLFDGFFGIGTDGQRIYVVGGSGYDLNSWTSASPMVASLPLDLSSYSWKTRPNGMLFATQVTVDDGVYVAGIANGHGRVVRCTLDGACP